MFGMPGFDPKNFDPSKMDPTAVREITQLLQQLPPDRMMKLQTLMHNMMAGIDVRKELEDFERTLPPGFREKMMASYSGMAAAQASPVAELAPSEVIESGSLSERDARITILQAVAEGRMSPEQAEKLL